MASKNEESLYEPRFDASWDPFSLLDLAQWINGLAFRDIEFSGAGLPVVKIGELKRGITTETKRTSESYGDEVRVSSGDMLFAWSGQPETSIDVYRWTLGAGWLNQHIFRVIPSASAYDDFFFYLLKYLKPWFIRIARNKQTTGLGHVTKSDLRALRVSLPPLPEQRAIAHILGTLDNKIELNRQMSATLEAMARALFESWFVRFDPVRAKAEGRDTGLPADIAALFPDSFEQSEIGEVPKEWRVGGLRDIAQVTMGQSPPGDTYNDTRSGLPFYQGKTDFGSRFPTRRIWCSAPTRFADASDVLVSVRAPVGSVNIATERCAIGRGLASVTATAVGRSYLFYNLLALEDQFSAYEAGGTVFGSINRDQLGSLAVAIVPPDVLDAFEQHGSGYDSSIRKAHEEALALVALRDTLLPKLISGELRVPDAQRMLASAGVS